MPAISVLLKPSSGMCNMSCEYCFYCDETEKRKQKSYGFMSEQTLKNVIRKTLLRADSCISYAYQGGEPTLRGIEFFQKAIEFQHQYNHRGIKVMNAMQTNGYLIDDTWCRFFKENRFLVGISIDGTKETHDCYRHSMDGADTYKKIVDATKLLDHYQVDYNILTVVNQKTAQNVSKIYADYKKHGWKYQQYIVCLDPLEETHGKNSFAIHPQKYGNFLIELFKLWYEDCKKGTQPYIRQFENYVGMLMGYLPEACDQCGICGMQNVVEADGSVYPCDFYMLDDYSLGNLNDCQLDRINEKRNEIGFIERSKKLDPTCYECEFFKLCRGGCRRNRDYMKEADCYHNYFCESYKMFFKECFTELSMIADKWRK